MKFFFDKNFIISKNQFGFRPKHSTTDSLIAIHREMCSARDRSEYVCAVALDLSKAFDLVNHEILHNKLRKYGLKNVISLIKSFLSERRQLTKIGNNISEERFLYNTSIIQGSILGPLLLFYLLMIFLN